MSLKRLFNDSGNLYVFLRLVATLQIFLQEVRCCSIFDDFSSQTLLSDVNGSQRWIIPALFFLEFFGTIVSEKTQYRDL